MAETGDGRAASGAVVVVGGGVAAPARFASAANAAVDVAAVAAVAAVEVLSRGPPAHGGITYARTLATLDSLARGSSKVGRASTAVETGDGRASSGAVVVGGWVVALSGRFTAVAVAAAELLSRDPPAHEGIMWVRTQAVLDSIPRGSSRVGRISVDEVGDGRAASGVVAVVAGDEVPVSVRSATVLRGRSAAAALLLRLAPLHGGMTKDRALAGLVAVAGAGAVAAGDTSGLGGSGGGVGRRGSPEEGGGVGTEAGASVASAATAIPCLWRLAARHEKSSIPTIRYAVKGNNRWLLQI